ncbi:MAG: periplasmic heavy metal sensor [Candidatus Aminicenantes bacterium]|nr:periplasmic heavy metal sensor [Candidatus Aminicenantes bacterium]
MKKKFGKLALLLLVVINVTALLTFAYNRWVRETVAPAQANPVLADDLTRQLCLSGKQEKCVKDFRLAFNSEIGDIRARLQEKRSAMVEELKKEPPDRAALDKLIDDISRLQAEIQKKAIVNILKEKEILTDEQKATFFRLFEDHLCPRAGEAKRSGASAGQADCPKETGR